MPYSPEALESARELYESSPGISQRAAAREFNLNNDTFRRYLADHQAHRVGHEAQQRLTKEQEHALETIIIHASNLGYPPGAAEVLDCANHFLRLGDPSGTLGKNWIHAFKKRHPAIQGVQSKRIDAARLMACQEGRLQTFIDLYSATLRKHQVRPEAIWNMDETGIIMNSTKAQELVYTSLASPVTFTPAPGNRASVTAIECISATGKALSTNLIFRSTAKKAVPTKTDTVNGKEYIIHASKTAYTCSRIFIEWLKVCFIPETGGSGPVRLLLLDGCSVHAIPEAMAIARRAGVLMLFLPAHTSHVLQPLDVGVFSPLKSAYRAAIGAGVRWTAAANVKKYTFMEAYTLAHKKAFTEKNVKSGFYATGLWPILPSKLLNNRFVSRTTSSTPSSSSEASVSRVPSTPVLENTSNPLRFILRSSPRRARVNRTLTTRLRELVAGDDTVRELEDVLIQQSALERTLKSDVQRLELELRHAQAVCNAALASAKRKRTAVDLNTRPHSVGDARYAVGDTEPFGGDEDMLDASEFQKLFEGVEED